MTRLKEVYRTIQRGKMIKDGQEKKWLVLLVVCLVISVIIGCGKQPKILSTGEIWLPEDVRYPPSKGYNTPNANYLGVFECKGEWYLCITSYDHDVLKYNYQKLFEAHKRMKYIIEEHNKDIRQKENVQPSERKCGAFDLKCRGEKNRGMRQ